MARSRRSLEKHRGRIQAQGKMLEESEAWSQNEPLTLKQAQLLLKKLESKLSKSDLADRESAFRQLQGNDAKIP